eukprot:4974390-Prorocentrum_lima.AAC.1
MFSDKREKLRPDVTVEWSTKYNRFVELGDGVYAEVKVAHQDMISAMTKEGSVTNQLGMPVEGP